jgi:hypothetical protein
MKVISVVKMTAGLYQNRRLGPYFAASFSELLQANRYLTEGFVFSNLGGRPGNSELYAYATRVCMDFQRIETM